MQELTIKSATGDPIGTVEEQWSPCMCYPEFVVRDSDGHPVLSIDGPTVFCSCCNDVEFTITSKITGAEIGKITKKCNGFEDETDSAADVDNFGITFPVDLDIEVGFTINFTQLKTHFL